MEINLLPKIPNTKKYRWHISIIVALVVFSASAFVGWQTWKNESIIKAQEDILKSLQNENDYYSEHLLANSVNTQLFNNYLTKLNLLRSEHLNWVIVFDGLSSKLPSDAKITNLTYTGGDSIMLNAEFTSISLEAQYIQWLKTIDWIKDITVVQSDSNQKNKYLMEIEIILNPQSLTKGGDLDE